MNKSELIKKLEDIEWEDFEVKEAKSEIPKNSWETVSAFSNTAGGWLIFGVSKKGKSYNILGVSNPEKIEQDFTTVLRNSSKLNRKIKVTFGGLLVFGTEDLLMNTITNYRIEYLEIPGISYQDAPTRYSFRISSEQNLWTTFFDIYERFPKKIDIPFKMVSGFRDDNPEHLQALREALVNLIIHTDYFSRANPRIRVFSNRFEFFNPGSLPKKIEYILQEDFSLPRNPIIAKIFRFVRLAESIGSGFHKMIKGWEQHYGLEPVIEGDFDYYKITFPTVTEKVPEKLGVKLGDRLGVKLGENELKILKLMEDNKYITTKELSEHIKISTTAVDNNISKLKKKGILKRIGPAKGGYWEVIEK